MSDTVKRLKWFVEWWNDGYLPVSTPLSTVLPSKVEEKYLELYTEQHYDPSSQRSFGLRMSSIGDPIGVNALRNLGYVSIDADFSGETMNASKHKFFLGFLTEYWLLQAMSDFGLDLSHMQDTVTFEGVVGHPDVVVGGDTVVDIKSAKSSSWSYMNSKGVSPVYTAQVQAYMSALKLKHGALLILNKDTQQLALHVVDSSEDALQALSSSIRLAKSFDSLDAFLEAYEAEPGLYIPECTPERYKGTQTGDCMVPTTMAFTGYSNVFYDLELAYSSVPSKKNPIYFVRGYRDTHGIKEQLIPYEEITL